MRKTVASHSLAEKDSVLDVRDLVKGVSVHGWSPRHASVGEQVKEVEGRETEPGRWHQLPFLRSLSLEARGRLFPQSLLPWGSPLLLPGGQVIGGGGCGQS